MTQYFKRVVQATRLLSDREDVLFLGQSISYPGNVLFNTLEAAEVPLEKRIELPVIEDAQMGMSIGLAIQGFLPVTMFPRFDFLLCATNQLVNHLDKFPLMSRRLIVPKVIIKTVVGSVKPLFPGYQHCGDYTEGYRLMLKNVDVVKLENAEEVVPAYEEAICSRRSTLIVEVADLYYE
jgi:pyruvate/2-oxoglutarate/acetoin dehydrogenase E1 component